MRILFIFHTTNLRGGASLSGLTLIRGLKELGHEVVVLCRQEGELSDVISKEGFQLKIFPFRMVWPHTKKTFGSFVKFIPRLIRDRLINKKAVKSLLLWVKNLQPDIIHSNTSVMSIGYVLSSKLKLPHVTHFREFGFKDTGFFSWHIRGMLKYSQQYNIAITNSIQYKHRLPEEHTKIIYNGIDCNKFEQIQNSDKKYLLYVGGLFAAKGLIDLINAYGTLPENLRRQFPLLLAGTSDDYQFIELLNERIAELKIQDHVKFLGHRKDVNFLMQHAKALIVPSKEEAFGRVVAEGMFNKCLVIGRNTRGIKEQFENGLRVTGHEIGLRFDNTEELSDKLLELLSTDSARYESTIGFASRTVECLYSVKSYVNGVAHFYQEILSDNIN